jgi:sulfite reductase (ferredoxin)
MVTPTAIDPTAPARRSKVEGLKENSHFLLEPVASELKLETEGFTQDGTQIIKFHGFYQQSNRDIPKGQPKQADFMLRTRSPGGFIPPELYLTLDRLCDDYGNHTIRATTRQGFQLHGILKTDLKASIAAIVRSMGSTLGACGDLNRNVMAPPAPYKNRPGYDLAWTYANNIADLLTPQTGAYYDIWLDGEKVISAEEDPEVVAARNTDHNGTNFPGNPEPIYGTHYMPRKFKCAVTLPGDNSVDLFTQDLSLVLILDNAGELQGFNLYAGGGMGRTHNADETFARVADPIGYVAKADIYNAVKAIVATQRDYSDRFNRRHSRLKYLINDWGVEKFRTQVEQYFGKPFAPIKETPDWRYNDYLGWQEQGDGKLFLGLFVQNGRVLDVGDFKLKTALRTIVEQFQLPMRVTACQDVVLYDIQPGDRAAIAEILTRNGIKLAEDIDPLVHRSIACPALPTCGLAITESERIIPSILGRIRGLLTQMGLPEESFVVRMTGCPNGCARPYMAELGLVGSGPEAYQLWLGGSPNQTRLARAYMQKLPDAQLETILEPMFAFFKASRKKAESFGDFCDRVGFDALREYVASYVPGQGLLSSGRQRWRVELSMGLHDRLKLKADAEGKSLRDLAEAALEDYLK